MKNKIFSILMLMILAFPALADGGSTNQIYIEHRHHGGNHSEHFIPADMPEVYYDSDAQEIILVANGFSSYYYVEIGPSSWVTPVISTQVDGYGDTIDVSALVSDYYYTIRITSEFGNQFEGEFLIE